MKLMALILVMFLLAGSVFAENDQLFALKEAMKSAQAQRDTGVVLTILGGVALGGGLISFLVGYMAIFQDIILHFSSFSASDLTDYTVWLVTSIGAMALGGIGLGVGIPFIIIGGVRYNRAERDLRNLERTTTTSVRPFIGVTPWPFQIRAGLDITL